MDFWENLLDSISGQTEKELIEKQLEIQEQIAIANAEAEAAKYSPEALAEKRKTVIGVSIAVLSAIIIIFFLYYKFLK